MGRKAGVPNRATTAVRERVTLLFERYSADQMWADLQECKPKDRLQIISLLSEFIAPKLQRSEVDQNSNTEITYKVVYEDEAPNPAEETAQGAETGT